MEKSHQNLEILHYIVCMIACAYLVPFNGSDGIGSGVIGGSVGGCGCCVGGVGGGDGCYTLSQCASPCLGV